MKSKRCFVYGVADERCRPGTYTYHLQNSKGEWFLTMIGDDAILADEPDYILLYAYGKEDAEIRPITSVEEHEWRQKWRQ